ncbi:MAG: hypothetical protein C0506_04415 [Anaerolinea sp.]|nr:hypothetical protein [Anaerolinea sp.]
MMEWARAKQAEEDDAHAKKPDSGPSPLAEGQPEDAQEPLDFDSAKRLFDRTMLHEALGLTLEELRPGYARVRLTTGRVTLGGVNGGVHGGVLAAMVDIAMLRAMVPLLRKSERAAGTVDLNITYLRPAVGDYIDAIAEVLRKGRTIMVTEVTIVDSGGRLCAKGRTIYALRPMDRGGV